MPAPTVFLAVPTYNGLESQPKTMEMIQRWQARLRARGGALSLAPIKGCSVIGHARAELTTWFLNARQVYGICAEHWASQGRDVRDFDPDNVEKHNVLGWLDDDVLLEAEDGLDRMLALIDEGLDIVSAPAAQRGDGRENTRFYITDGPVAVGRDRVWECAQTGFGCVVIRRSVIERMVAEYDDYCGCQSGYFPGLRMWAMYNSIVVPARSVDPGATEDSWPVLLHDDYAWSLLARRMRFRIHAAIDIATDHRGLRCAVGEEYDRKVQQEGGRLVLAR